MSTHTSPRMSPTVSCGTCRASVSLKKDVPRCCSCQTRFHLTRTCSGFTNTGSWTNKKKKAKSTWKCGSCRPPSARGSTNRTKPTRTEDEDDSVFDDDLGVDMPILGTADQKLDYLVKVVSKLVSNNAELVSKLSCTRLDYEEALLGERSTPERLR